MIAHIIFNYKLKKKKKHRQEVWEFKVFLSYTGRSRPALAARELCGKTTTMKMNKNC